MFFFNQIFFTQYNELNMGKIIPSIEKEKYLPFIKDYFGKISQRKIARRRNVGKTTINTWTAELGFKHVKHTVNDRFFDLLTEDVAYLLGFIYADGNISWNPQKGYYCLTITAAAKDKEHLEKMRAMLSSTKPLLFSSKTNSYRLIVNNKYLCERLMMLGVLPRKSLTVQFPQFIPSDHLRHFIRGVIDGDGTVYYLNRKRSPYFSIRIYSGSEEFVTGIKKEVKNTIGIDANIRKRRNANIYGAEYTCARGKILANYIYKNATFFLERKYLPYKNNVLEVKENGK